MFKMTLKCGDKEVEVTGVAGSTSPYDIKRLAADLFGNNVSFTVRSPAIGLYATYTSAA